MKLSPKKIAVIGGGFFGTTTAFILAEAGHRVELFEQEKDLLQAASGINQFRLHRGYHYPRSAETARECLSAESQFVKEFPGLVSYDDEHYYCIAREKSMVTPEQFASFCDAIGLEYEEAYPSIINRAAVAWSIRVREGLIRITAIREYIKQRLLRAGVRVHLGVRAQQDKLDNFDAVVLCTYASNNRFLSGYTKDVRAHQYELCEKIVIELPREFRQKSVVIMDGPFTCIDPLCDTPYHLMGNVVHAIHVTSIGEHPELPEEYTSLLNAGIIKDPHRSYFDRFIESATHFFPEVHTARHKGSMFTVRTVLPHLDATDARPTLIESLDDRIIRVFSGKIGNCVPAAYEVRSLITEKR